MYVCVCVFLGGGGVVVKSNPEIIYFSMCVFGIFWGFNSNPEIQ